MKALSDKAKVEQLTDTLADLLRPSDEENRATELSLWKVWAYHCYRCNYLWFPKDYDYGLDNPILNMTPPTSCARCKSKYWNKIPQRRTKNYDNMLALPRIVALSLKYFLDRFGSPEEFQKVYREFMARNPYIKDNVEFDEAFRKEFDTPDRIIISRNVRDIIDSAVEIRRNN